MIGTFSLGSLCPNWSISGAISVTLITTNASRRARVCINDVLGINRWLQLLIDPQWETRPTRGENVEAWRLIWEVHDQWINRTSRISRKRQKSCGAKGDKRWPHWESRLIDTTRVNYWALKGKRKKKGWSFASLSTEPTDRPGKRDVGSEQTAKWQHRRTRRARRMHSSSSRVPGRERRRRDLSRSRNYSGKRNSRGRRYGSCIGDSNR